jgi:hypothetical protein
VRGLAKDLLFGREGVRGLAKDLLFLDLELE